MLALGGFAYDALSQLPGGEWAAEARDGPPSLTASSRLPPLAARSTATRRRGRWLPGRCCARYHPSQRNVFTGLLTAEMFDDRARSGARARR
jgi:uracil-DNA glycosylase